VRTTDKPIYFSTTLDNRQINKTDYRNVRLLTVDDPFYQIYLSQFKHDRQKDVVYDKPIPKKSQTMGYLLEISVNEWVKKSGVCLDEKNISYEYGHGKRHKRIFKELDYVLRRGKSLFVGEVKVSSSEKGSISTACDQLTFSKELLSRLADNVTMQIIRIDLNFKNAAQPFDNFTSDFTKAVFRDFEWNEIKFKLLYLNAQDVFNYGVQNKIIKSPEIFQPVVYETDLLHKRRQTKKELKEKSKSLIEITDPDQAQIISEDIKILEQKIFLDDIKINLSEKGWAHLTNVNADGFTAITNSIGKSIEQASPTNDFCSRTNGYCTDNPATKLIAFYCDTSETELNLLDAERVYLRIPIEEGHELQNIDFVIADNSLDNLKSYPLFNRFPTRKFFYSDKLLRQSDSENKSLKHYEQVINNSQPSKILLQLGDLLIIDNHRMLHQRTANTDKLKRKIILDEQ
jgi:hypothetical protein